MLPDNLHADDGHAAGDLLPLVYDELRRLAAAQMARERPDQTLDATGLVHEAYLPESRSGRSARRGLRPFVECQRAGSPILAREGTCDKMGAVPRESKRPCLRKASMRDLLSELTALLDQGRRCIYCSVVETRGSTPQKAGAAMLVFPDGSQRGTLGGGCVEAEVKQNALRILANGGRPEVFTFSLDDNYGWDDGLICGGRMTMLVDPLADNLHQHRVYYRRFYDLVESGLGCTEAVVLKEEVGAPVGQRYLYDAEGRLAIQLGQSQVPERVTRHLPSLAQRPRPSAQQGIAYLPILPRITLLIVGGGHVGQAVARLGAEVDFDIWVVDDRERYASRERFPMAGQLLVGNIGTVLKELAPRDITRSFYCLVITRGHAHDEEALYHLVTTQAGYVGMIGSKRKIKLIFEDLVAKGISPELLERVHAPLGYEIGSQTVPEIAISIVAELIACRNLGTTKLAERVPVRAGNVRA
jgi:xanthine dehydrogenase accessory factor